VTARTACPIVPDLWDNQDAGAAELRVRDSAGIYRAFYVVKVVDAVLIFHAFAKKSQKTPDREIELGKKRLKEMLR